MTGSKTDSRIAYGALCTWWDSIDKVGSNGGLPCCPHCRGVLYEMTDLATWDRGVKRYQDAGNPGYVDKITWARGQCFKNLAALEAAYHKRL